MEKLIITDVDYYKDGGSLFLETNWDDVVIDRHFEGGFGGKAMRPLAGRCTFGYCDHSDTKEERVKVKELTLEQIQELLQVLDAQIPGQLLDFEQYAKEIRAFYNL